MQRLEQNLGRFLVLLVIAGMYVIIFSKNEYNPYHTNPELSEASEITTKLEESITGLDNFKTLRDIAEDLKNFYFFTRSVANKTKYKTQKGTINDGYNAISSSIEKLAKLSETERKLEIKKIATFTRQEIERLQNPSQCSKSPLLVYDIGISPQCGFGCMLHTVVIAFMKAFNANRTFVLKSKNWLYAKEGWEYIFLPLGSCNTTRKTAELPLLKNSEANNNSEQMVAANLNIGAQYLWSVPKEFASKLGKLQGDPYAWWVGQFASYSFRFQPWFQKVVDKQAEEMGFTESAVGIQIRWGDKLMKEANRYPVEQYMEFAENWYKQLEFQGRKVERVVYLATEDLLARNLITIKFPHYKFISLAPWARRTMTQLQRFKHKGLTSIAMDIHFLSRCSYLVCTLSSSVCRTAYELMLVKNADASTRFQSLDTRHHLRVHLRRNWTAIMDHHPSGPQELDIKKGDKILASLEHHQKFNEGFLRGTNQRTKKRGLFPLFMAREDFYAYNVSTFRGSWRDTDDSEPS